MPNLNLQREAHELTNVSMLLHVAIAHYFIEFSPFAQCFQQYMKVKLIISISVNTFFISFIMTEWLNNNDNKTCESWGETGREPWPSTHCTYQLLTATWFIAMSKLVCGPSRAIMRSCSLGHWYHQQTWIWQKTTCVDGADGHTVHTAVKVGLANIFRARRKDWVTGQHKYGTSALDVS